MKYLTHIFVGMLLLISWLPVFSDEPTGNKKNPTPLVSLATVAQSSGLVKVVGVVDLSSLLKVEIKGRAGISFDIEDGESNRLGILFPGKTPIGFDQAHVVVVTGTYEADQFVATKILLPGAASWPDPNRGLTGVMAITLVIWIVLFAYIFFLDRKIKKLEE